MRVPRSQALTMRGYLDRAVMNSARGGVTTALPAIPGAWYGSANFPRIDAGAHYPAQG